MQKAALARAKAAQQAKEALQCAVVFEVALAAFHVASFDGAAKERFAGASAASLGVDPGQVRACNALSL